MVILSLFLFRCVRSLARLRSQDGSPQYWRRFWSAVRTKALPQHLHTQTLSSGPTAYAKANGRTIPDNRSDDTDYIWRDSTISHMLSRPEYLGHTVNFKTYRKSYKQKKQLKRDPSEWQIFENTHGLDVATFGYGILRRLRSKAVSGARTQSTAKRVHGLCHLS